MACNTINSTLEIFTIILLCILMATILLKEKKDKNDWFFFTTTLLHTVNTMGDLAAWRFAGKPGTLALAMATVGNYTTYIASVLVYTSFMILVYQNVTDRKWTAGMGKALVGLIGALALCGLAFILTNHWTGALYTISADNTFTWGRWCTAADNIVLVQMLLTLFLVLHDRNRTKPLPKTLMLFLVWMAIPAAAIIVENWYPVLMLLYPAMAITLLLIYVSSQKEQEKRLLEQDNELLARKLELNECHTALMLSQIKPHFLFNSLNSIYHLCDIDVKKAQQAVGDFSEYLRENLNALSSNEPVPFDTELDYVRHYLSLEKLRFGEELGIVYDIQTTDFFLPHLTVQPLVENAVKHGLGYSLAGGTVTIATRELDDCFLVIVSDDGIGLEPEKPDSGSGQPKVKEGHFGIANVKSRLWDMSRATLEIESGHGKGTCVTIRIPKEECEAFS